MRKNAVCLGLIAAALSHQNALAEDVIIHIFNSGKAVEGIEVVLDGEQRALTGAQGNASFEIDSTGSHRIQLIDDGITIHSFRFSNAAKQNVDINVQMRGDDAPYVAIETYKDNETMFEKLEAAKGELKGVVTSEETGEPAAGAEVSVEALGISTKADSQGNFVLELPRGTYDVSVKHSEYGRQTLREISVASGISKSIRASVSNVGDVAQPIEEVITVGVYRENTFAAQKQASVNVLDVLDEATMARYGDSNAADSVQRVVGINVQDGKYVFVRGLGGRYTTTTLNNSSMPSTDPSRRTTPLDLFPSGVIKQIEVKKTYTADMPGDSSAGNVQIKTRGYPEEMLNKISLSVAYNDRITTMDALTNPDSGSWDFIGYDDGSREMPAIVDALTDFGSKEIELEDPSQPNQIGGISEQVLEVMGESFPLTNDYDVTTAAPNFSFGLSHGNVFEFDENEVGYFLSGKYSRKWETQDDGIKNEYTLGGNGLIERGDFDYVKDTLKTDVSLMFSMGAQLGADHSIESNTLYSHKNNSSVKFSEGFGGDNSEQQKSWVIDWEERTFFSQQLKGEHVFPDAQELVVDWQWTFSYANRQAPDRREIIFNEEVNGAPGVQFDQSGYERRYDDLEDFNRDLSTNVTLPFFFAEDLDGVFKGGVQLIGRNRNSKLARFTFQDWAGSITDKNNLLTSTQSVDVILAPENINEDGWRLFNSTQASDKYRAFMTNDALYGSAEFNMGPLWAFNVGVRYEDFWQEIETYSGGTLNTASQQKNTLEQSDVMPAINATWFINEEMQIRFGLSQTVSRPDFKEMANAKFYDPIFDTAIFGNPDLEIAEVMSFDVRWEWYFSSTENLTIAAFIKNMDNPIEKTIELSSSGEDRTFKNSPEAQISGIEFDIRKEVPIDAGFSRSFFVAFNASLIDSTVDLEPGNVEGRSQRELQGQADLNMNIAIGYDNIDAGQRFTLLINHTGDNIAEVGVFGAPNTIQEAITKANLNYEWEINQAWMLKAQIENLTDAKTEFTVDGANLRSYREGRVYQVGVNYEF